MVRRRKAKGEGRKAVTEGFPAQARWTVSGMRVGGICLECECRVFEFAGENDIRLAWCECGFPEDHHGMEILSA
jgi:hypothetical protein